MKNKFILTLALFAFTFNIAGAQGVTTSGCLELTRNLKQGMKNPVTGGDIFNLQSFLKNNGYLSVYPTGYYGSMTTKAVKNLQNDNAISQTGTVGPLTRKLIKDKTCTNLPVITPAQPPETAVIPVIPSTTTEPVNPPVVIVVPAPATITEDVILTAPNNSSLKVRTDGPVTIGSNSVTVRGTITAGARSATVRWFELTKNKDVYKLSETTQSTKKSQRTNDNFQEVFDNLTSGTTYYIRACAENADLGQKSCGSTTSFKTNN